MSMFTLAISCLTTPNLPWFLHLTFQLPMQYCSLQHWTLLPSPVISTAGCCSCFGSIPHSFWSYFATDLQAYWAPTDSGSSSFSVLSFRLFLLFMGFSRQEYWSGWPFRSPLDHVLSELSPWLVHLGGLYTAWLTVSLKNWKIRKHKDAEPTCSMTLFSPEWFTVYESPHLVQKLFSVHLH